MDRQGLTELGHCLCGKDKSQNLKIIENFIVKALKLSCHSTLSWKPSNVALIPLLLHHWNQKEIFLTPEKKLEERKALCALSASHIPVSLYSSVIVNACKPLCMYMYGLAHACANQYASKWAYVYVWRPEDNLGHFSAIIPLDFLSRVSHRSGSCQTGYVGYSVCQGTHIFSASSEIISTNKYAWLWLWNQILIFMLALGAWKITQWMPYTQA